jgi:CubicO group peptidase (beta-lactamase class C family)
MAGPAPTGRYPAITPQPIASMTKPFPAVAVLQPVDEGLVELDAPARTYLTEFAAADPQSARQITVRQLLEHTSGLSDSGYGGLLDPDTTLNEASVTCGTPKPRKQYQYLNATTRPSRCSSKR